MEDKLKNITKIVKILILSAFLFSLASGCRRKKGTPNEGNNFPFNPPSNVVLDPFEQNKLLARSVNLGNALDAPNEGDWGVTLQADYFSTIAKAGFTAVRIPIRWSTHASENPPYTIDPKFMARTEWTVKQALQNNLAAIINIHHYDSLYENPQAQKGRFIGLWTQIAAHYKNYPDQLFFEILNEPHDRLVSYLWNTYLQEAVHVIRQSNPTRTLIIGGVQWNSVDALDNLQLPEDDQNIIATFHYYNPFHFTHQGAGWVSGSNAWLGTTWSGTKAEKAAVKADLDKAVEWAAKNKRPLFMGEFGAYSKADMRSRAFWTDYVARQCEARNISWAYWEFCSGFGVYDPDTNTWRNALLRALIP